MSYYFVVYMPLTKDGQGPATAEETAQETWEVWNHIHQSIGSYTTLKAAEYAANVLNTDMEVEVDYAVRKALGTY